MEQAKVSHEAGTAVVTLSEDVTDDVLKNAVEAQDYPVTDAFDKMLGETDYVLCPEHYKEGVFGIEGNR